MARLLLVRHGRPTLDPTTAPSAWGLAPGSRDAAALLGEALGLSTPLVAASTERKAIETAEALHTGLGPGTALVVSPAFCEVRKPWFDEPSEHEAATAQYLSGGDPPGWEPRSEAIARFERGRRVLDAAEETVVVTHGTVMTAWLAATVAIDDPAAFWSALRLPDAWEVDLAERRAWRVEP